jgi:hypothetical protein
MKNNTEKQNEIPELKETSINISVRTGLMHKSKADEAQTQIDYSGFYINAINYFIRIALEAQSHLDMQTDSVVLRNDVKFRENLQFMIQLTEAFIEWLPDYSNVLFDGADKTEQPEVLNLPEQSEDSQNLNELAAHLSAVMKDPLTPPEIYNVLGEYFVHVPADTDSPEWILGNLKKMQGDKNE